MGQGGGFRIPIGGAAGGGGLSGIIILVVLFFALRACGIDPMAILGEGGSMGPGGGQVSQSAPQSNDQMKQFVSTVLAETEDTWNGIFQANGLKYEEPTLVLFSGQTKSACGFASAASGPFIVPTTARSISICPSTTSSTASSAPRAISRRPMCWRMRSATMCRT